MISSITTIVCTRNRSASLIRCLKSIEEALSLLHDMKAEIVIVNNNSSDDTASRIEEFSRQCRFKIMPVFEGQAGVSRARNAGISRATGDVLFFTDDDCCVDKNYYIDGLKHIVNKEQIILVGGRVLLGNKEDSPTTIQPCEYPRSWSCNKPAGSDGPLRGGMILGCNFATTRAILDKIGGFDNRLGPGTGVPAGEDTDLFFRAYLAGADIKYYPDMTVYHYHGRRTENQLVALNRNYVMGAGALYVKYHLRHPNVRTKIAAILRRYNAHRGTKTAHSSAISHNMYLKRSEKLAYALLGGFRYMIECIKNS